MSRGLGRVQNGCLVAIWNYERRGKLATAYDIVGEVYRLDRDTDGAYWMTAAQHIAVKRALAGLQRKGRVISFRMSHDERHFCWMSERRAQQLVRENKKAKPVWVAHVRAKMRAIGMKAG
jgi:hypothetical protein